MYMLTSKKFWKAVSIRAIKTISQTATALIGTAVFIEEVSWLGVLSGSLLAGVLSVLTNIGGVPEVQDDENKN